MLESSHARRIEVTPGYSIFDVERKGQKHRNCKDVRNAVARGSRPVKKPREIGCAQSRDAQHHVAVRHAIEWHPPGASPRDCKYQGCHRRCENQQPEEPGPFRCADAAKTMPERNNARSPQEN